MQRCARCGALGARERACASCGAPAPTAPDVEPARGGRGRTEVGAFVPPPSVALVRPADSAILAVLTRPARRSPLEQLARALFGVALALGLALGGLLGVDALARGGAFSSVATALAPTLGVGVASLTRALVLTLVAVGALAAGYLGPRLAGGRR